MKLDDFNVDESKLLIITGASTCVITTGILVVRKLTKKRITKRKLRRSATSDVELWETLKQMDTAEFLTTLDEMLCAYQMRNLAISREKLRVIMLTRQKQLADELKDSKDKVDSKLEKMGGLLKRVRSFITENLLKADHKSLNRLKDYFDEIAKLLVKVSAEPELLLNECTDESTLSFDDIRDLFTILVSAGTSRNLKSEAKGLKDELEDSWHELRKSKSSYKHALADIDEWNEFFEENSDLITEILDKREWWPES